MNRKVKVISYRDNLITLEIDGQRLCYFADRPQPLGPGDVVMFRDAMDTKMVEALFKFGNTGVGVLPRFAQWLRRFLESPWHTDAEGFTVALIAKRLEEVGVPFEVGGTKCLAILQSDIKQLKKKGVI